MVNAISILGCTGSIGRQTAAVAEHTGIRVAALTANRKIDLLEQQARQFHPSFVAVYDEEAAKAFKIAVADTDIRVGSGMEGLIEAATLASADCVVTAVSGAVGLKPTLAAIDAKKRIALANKETLVCAGAGGFRALRHLPVPDGQGSGRAAQDPAHRLGRPLPREEARGAGGHHARPGGGAIPTGAWARRSRWTAPR